MHVDELLAELDRLEATAPDAARKPVPEPLTHFRVCAASPLALDRVQIVPTSSSSSSLPPPGVFSTSPLALSIPAAHARQQLEARVDDALDTARWLQELGPFPRGFVWDDAAPSRTLAQMPMRAPTMELVPKREHLVRDPCKLTYEFRAIDTSHTGADAGFAGALAKQTASFKDEYARGKMSNTPFAPGGNSLVDVENATATAARGGDVGADADAQDDELEALVIQGDSSLESDLEKLSRLVVKAPGLEDCLTLDDVLELERLDELEQRREETEADSDVVLPFPVVKDHGSSADSAAMEDDEAEAESVASNPKSLLQPYMAAVKDVERAEAIQSMVRDVRAAAQMHDGERENGSVELQALLQGMDEDEDLTELGFHIDAPTESVAQPPAAKESSHTSAIVDNDASEDEPEQELDAMLAGNDASGLLSDQAKDKAATTEWASIASVDVRNFHEKVPEMAIKYEFELDTFQKECVIHLEQHECVFVAAHTSAGKTVIAEYAIAMSQKHMTRTIYTSPIKALSNQKYRDFRTKFGADNVGLITGDVSINPDASCLVMTTEILRSMLYRGADVIRDIEWVIFDEIHYINDSERGVVWEEVIIMLPEHVGMVFLSATTPNHLEFSDWIGRTKKKKIHVISTFKRPVPLEHFLYANKELFKVFDATSGFNAAGYSAAKAKLAAPSDNKAKSAGGRAGGGGSASTRSMGRSSGGDQSDWTKLITVLKDKGLLPVVVFAFSKRLCEESAGKLSKLDLSSSSERSEIHLFLEASVQRLHGSDRELPQVLAMKEMLKRGIGVHHGGLLPIIKEMVEILFARGLVKVLFSTETFAMGVNMPARTVVFNGIRKHDGKNFRDLLPGEYTQMAGRAGRRGLDTVGTVIIACWNDVNEATALQQMMAGKATALSSQFRLTYNMILNLMRVEVLTVEDMMKRSFSEFHTQKELSSRRVPQLITRGKKLLQRLEASLEEEYAHLEETGELLLIREFNELLREKKRVERQLMQWILNNSTITRAAISPGRVVLVNVNGLPGDIPALVVRTSTTDIEAVSMSVGVVSDEPTSRARGVFKHVSVICFCSEDFEPPQTNEDKPKAPGAALHDGRLLRSKKSYDEDLMIMGGRKGGAKTKEAKELESNTKGSMLGKTYTVLDIPETCITSVTAWQVPSGVNLKNLVAISSKKELSSALEFLDQVEKDMAESHQTLVAFVDVINELRVSQLDVAQVYDRWHQLFQQVASHPCSSNLTTQARPLAKVDKIAKLKDYITRMTLKLSNDALHLFPDFQQRLSVLRRLGYISDDGVVQVKGRVACEINTCEEIVLTEMIFENVLANLEPEEIVAVLSALIFQEKTQNEPTLTPRLENAREVVKAIAESLGVIQLEQHLDIDPAVYCRGALNFGLMEVVYEWARGMPFKQLCDHTDIPEGSIVRCITRLDEVCREVRNAARVIGDPRLYRKMEVASEAIKRDVVFASSLYLS